MSNAPLMLSVSGMRGIVGESLTEEVAARFAGAFASYLREDVGVARPRVVVARDGRAGGAAIRDAAASGLAAAGCQLIDIDVAMTPTVGVAVDHLGADGALTATASHNPQQWNGLKTILAGNGAAEGVRLSAGAAAADAATADKIIRRFRSMPEATIEHIEATDNEDAEAALIREYGATRLHMDKVIDALGQDLAERIRERGFAVVVDSVNASGVHGTQLLMQRLGCELHHIGGDESGVFPHTPEPTRENLTGLCEEVQQHGAAVGFAQDPDADRLATVDERGEYIGEEYTLALAAMAIFELGLADGTEAKSQGADGRVTVCANLSTSRMIDDVAARYGARVLRTAVGEANVVAGMRSAGAALGGEGNGGVIWPRVTLIRDSLSAMGLVLGLLATTGATLSELVAKIPAYAIVKRKVDLARREDADRAALAVAARWEGQPGIRVDKQDGVRVDFNEESPFGAAWVHVRASNTEPIMRLIGEAGTPDLAEALLDEAAGAIGGS